MKLLPWTNM